MDDVRGRIDNSQKLVRAVGLWGLVAMCINAVVGSGVFLLPSESFKLIGPFSLWAPLLFALPVFILVICFAEASSCFTEPGGAYLYARTAFGDFVGFETGWMNWIARVTSLAALSNGFVVSLARIFPQFSVPATRQLTILGMLLALAAIHLVGVRYGAGSIYVFTVGKLLPLIAFIVVALSIFPHNPIPGSFAIPRGDVDWSEAALLLLFAYAGFENLGVPAGEYKNPKRDLPLALLFGILGIAVVYVLSQLAAMSALPDLSRTDTPIADAAGAVLGNFGALMITAGAVLSIVGTNSGTMLEGSRMLYAISLERPRLRAISLVHSTFHTPWVAILIHTAVAIPLALGGSFAKLAAMSAVARMTTYLFTCAAIPRLRKIFPGGFRAPGGLLFPILGTAISIVLFATLKQRHLVAAFVALTVGAVIYWVSKPATSVAAKQE